MDPNRHILFLYSRISFTTMDFSSNFIYCHKQRCKGDGVGRLPQSLMECSQQSTWLLQEEGAKTVYE